MVLPYIVFLTSLISRTPTCSSCIPVEIALRSYGVIPDLVRPNATSVDFVVVTYPNKLQIILGNVLGLNQTQQQPTYVGYYAKAFRYYTLLMLDPDVPSRTNTTLAQVRHWHVGNIPGDDVASGEKLAVYMGPMPDPLTGPHRYVFLVYVQPKKLVFTEPRLLDTSGNGRLNFSLDNYVKKYNLSLVAANFYQTEYGNEKCRQGYQPVEPLV